MSSISQRYTKWPWPTILPFANTKWFTSLKIAESNSQRVRSVMIIGDTIIVSLLALATYKFYSNYTHGAYRTGLYHTTGLPPALIAQEFSFSDPSKNRTVTRKQLDAYRTEVAGGKKVEDVIFKY
eukprot:PhF_6_TR19821/c0_g1_i1/m.28903